MKLLGIGIPELIIILIFIGIPILIAVLVSRSSEKKAQRILNQEGQVQFDSAPPVLPVILEEGHSTAQSSREMQQPSEEHPQVLAAPSAAAQPLGQAQAKAQGQAATPASPKVINQEMASDIHLYQAFAEGTKVGASKQRTVWGIISSDVPFSGFAFFLGPFYFAYRKCLVEMLVIFAIMALTLVVDIPASGLLFGWCMGLFFIPFIVVMQKRQ